MTPRHFRDPASPRPGLDGIDGPRAESPGTVPRIDRERAWQPLRLPGRGSGGARTSESRRAASAAASGAVVPEQRRTN